MHKTHDLPDLLKMIDERSSVFRAVVQSAPDLTVQVPTCPEWTLLDLARHVGGGQRRWAGIVAAGPGAGKPALSGSEIGESAPAERAALLAWMTESTRQLLDALNESGPDRGCWTWWDFSETPETSGAVARHMVHEVAVHTYDAQAAVGTPQPVPHDMAVDGVEEFSITCGTTKEPWPYAPALIDCYATDGPAWRVTCSPAGITFSRLSSSDTGEGTGMEAPTAYMRGDASDMVLALYDRLPMTALELGGDLNVIDQLRTWEM